MEIRELKTDSDLNAAYAVLKELRPHLTFEALVKIFPWQQAQGYRLFALLTDQTPVACIGWRILQKLSSGKTLYIDDLVTASAHRGKGHARALLDFAQTQAKAAECNALSLDSGHQRFDAHRLYLNFGFRIVAHHFSKEY